MAPSDFPDPSTRPSTPRSSRHDHDEEGGSDRQFHVAGMMIGTALMFIGFLNVFLSISGGFEINVVPLLIYFGGIAVWANAVVENPTIRYSLMAAAILISLALFHYGEVLFWHKQVVFWSTIVVVMYFMFNEPKRAA
ncbi:hypothetical protein FBQ96_08235 [Nitrospirales bacterium NOB]|nr:MAG: hypothetical protein UZ03_NOB001000579 [Nitrospira sp. OLB3]MBV6471535.1 hypothetical protein [Nitrospirota bacterium]MCE7966184.1 hypothetical protein [Nitrospira sp. NTP2]MCK6492093.1 hypothetical protein [Nitrospira sp.]MDL1889553.1 hypothetical protein [Nitrospirales bacterium NOB]MEB2339214.1 hypothetical protein [Nitrospirales bacterium]